MHFILQIVEGDLWKNGLGYGTGDGANHETDGVLKFAQRITSFRKVWSEVQIVGYTFVGSEVSERSTTV